jgi:hypothetical protein
MAQTHNADPPIRAGNKGGRPSKISRDMHLSRTLMVAMAQTHDADPPIKAGRPSKFKKERKVTFMLSHRSDQALDQISRDLHLSRSDVVEVAVRVFKVLRVVAKFDLRE